MIKEVIIVEGRDDEVAVKRAIDAEIIKTNGFGINENTYKRIETAYKNKGIIIFTDPDYAGDNIRKKLAERFPNAKHAHLSKHKAIKNKNIGIENASDEDIREALQKVKAVNNEVREEFTKEDMVKSQLAGNENAVLNREKVGDILGIGYSNSNTFLKRLNNYNISRDEFDKATKSITTKRIEE